PTTGFESSPNEDSTEDSSPGFLAGFHKMGEFRASARLDFGLLALVRTKSEGHALAQKPAGAPHEGGQGGSVDTIYPEFGHESAGRMILCHNLLPAGRLIEQRGSSCWWTTATGVLSTNRASRCPLRHPRRPSLR